MNKFPLLAILILTATILAPANARADRLFTGDDWGTNFYEFDTRAGGWSQIVFCNRTQGINGMNTDGKGKLYAADCGSASILKFNSDGTYTIFARLDNCAGACSFDTDGNLFVPFFWAKKIEKWSADGRSHSLFSTNVAGPEAVLFDGHGNLFVADQGSGHIYKFDPAGTQTTFASGLLWPGAILFDRHGTLFVADDHANTIYEFAPDGTRTVFSHKVKSPYGLAFDRRGNLFVSNGTGKIFKFKNRHGALSNDPTLFATDLGHDYWIFTLPGSMPLGTLLLRALVKLWMFWVPAALLAAGLAGFAYLRRKKRPAAEAAAR